MRWLLAMTTWCVAFTAAFAAEAGTGAPAAAEAAKPADAAAKPAAKPTYTTVTIANDVVELIVSTNRGGIERFSLKNTHPIELPSSMRESIGAEKVSGDVRKTLPQDVLAPLREDGIALHGWIVDDSWGISGDDVAPWAIAASDATSVTLTHATPEHGVTYELSYAIDAKRPTVHASLIVRNAGKDALESEPWLIPIRGVHQDYPPGETYYSCWLANHGGVEGKLDYGSLPTVGGTKEQATKAGAAQAPADYVGIKSRFFAALWEPQHLETSAIGAAAAAAPVAAPVAPRGDRERDASAPAGVPATGAPIDAWRADIKAFTNSALAHQAQVNVVFAKQRLEPNQQQRLTYDLTIADMRDAYLDLLTPVERKAEYTDAYYKFFRILTRLLKFLIDTLEHVVRNYGLAIVLLTCLLKALLHKANVKQHTSIMKMQRIAPQIKALQEQYKDNKQTLAMKQMELMKKHGANPLGGCLPALVQVPIFIALFLACRYSSELRGHGFLWINDLTMPDSVLALGFTFARGFPLYGGYPAALNILPLLYIAVTVWMSFSQKPPVNADPQQQQMAQMTRWMPVFFGVFVYYMPSALVLYMTTNAILSTLEIRYIKARLAKQDAAKGVTT